MANLLAARRGVLIIDPRAHMAGLVATMLRAIGRTGIREVNEASSALLELERQAYEVIIMDDAIHQPGAVELVRRIRTGMGGPNRDTPIIMTSAAPDTASIKMARDAGVTEFLRKPFATAHLQARLDSIETNPRHFIETAAFTGPDRRRRVAEPAKGERRSSDKT